MLSTIRIGCRLSKTKLNQMIMSAVPVEGEKKAGIKPKSFMQNLLDQSTATNDSLHFKQFSGGNHLWVESVGLDGDRIMGRTADILFFDEVQKTTGMAIGNSLKVLTTAKYGEPGKGVQVYFGTPRRKGSDFYKMWQTSSQQYYYLGCENVKSISLCIRQIVMTGRKFGYMVILLNVLIVGMNKISVMLLNVVNGIFQKPR